MNECELNVSMMQRKRIHSLVVMNIRSKKKQASMMENPSKGHPNAMPNDTILFHSRIGTNCPIRNTSLILSRVPLHCQCPFTSLVWGVAIYAVFRSGA
jgi:hypothetical protein